MKRYKPDLNEKLTIRLSVDSKLKLTQLCERHDLDESTMSRAALEAGMQIAIEKGLGDMLEKRSKVILPVKLKSPKEKPAFTIQKGSGAGWKIVNESTGKVVGRGPLYQLRPKARTMAGDKPVNLIRKDGTIERVA